MMMRHWSLPNVARVAVQVSIISDSRFLNELKTNTRKILGPLLLQNITALRAAVAA
jgi:hypothetical protein